MSSITFTLESFLQLKFGQVRAWEAVQVRVLEGEDMGDAVLEVVEVRVAVPGKGNNAEYTIDMSKHRDTCDR